MNQVPRIYAVGEIMNGATSASEFAFEKQPEPSAPSKANDASAYMPPAPQRDQRDEIWLTRFHTIRRYAIRRVIDKDMPRVKRAFMRNARHGACCTGLLRVRDFYAETITYLHQLGFTFMPAMDMCKNSDGSCMFYDAALPPHCDNEKMNDWINRVREVYFKAQRRLVERQCKSIKSEFEKAAKERKSNIILHENYCIQQTAQAVMQRFGCKVQSFRKAATISIED